MPHRPTYTPAIEDPESDFSAGTISALRGRGVTLLSVVVIPVIKRDGPVSFATGQRGYSVSDNGTNRVWSHCDVVHAANGLPLSNGARS